MVTWQDRSLGAGGATGDATGYAVKAQVFSVNETPTGGVTITGTATEDQVLTANTSTLADVDGLGTLHYQWQRNIGGGFNNVGLDQATYTLGDADVGATMRVAVSYTDGHGNAESTTSAASAAVANVNDAPSGAPAVTGTATEDQVLTANTSTIADADGLGTLHYQWQRNSGSGFSNVGLDQATYTLGDADVGATMRVVGQLHRRAGHGRVPDQRGNRCGRQRQRCAERRAGRHRHGDRRPDPHRQYLDASPMPTGSGRCTTSGSATAAAGSTMSASTRRPTPWATPMSAPRCGWSSATPTPGARRSP